MPADDQDYGQRIALLQQRQIDHDKQISEVSNAMREGFASIERNIESMRSTFATSRAANWPLLISSLFLAFALIGGGWTIVKMHTEGTVSPLLAALQLVQQDEKAITANLTRVSDVQQMTRTELAANGAGDAGSRDDRVHLNSAVDTLTKQTSENEATRREQNATIREKLTEVETQFRAGDEMRNLQWAEMRRTLALLWQKSYGEPYPSDVAYYPRIGQSPGPTTNGK